MNIGIRAEKVRGNVLPAARLQMKARSMVRPGFSVIFLDAPEI